MGKDAGQSLLLLQILSGKNDLKEYVITKFVYFHHTLNVDSDSCIKAVKSAVSLFGLPTRIIARRAVTSFFTRQYILFHTSQAEYSNGNYSKVFHF